MHPLASGGGKAYICPRITPWELGMSAVLDPIPTDAAPVTFADAIARVETGKERIILTRADKAVVALVPIADLEAIEDAEDAAAAADGLTEYEHPGKSWPSYTVEELAARWA
jgi:antitoxin (DNA-binding transcriptional repressor) of toxin-antitoxin stability system